MPFRSQLRSRTGPNESLPLGTGGDIPGRAKQPYSEQMHGLPSPAFDSLIEAMAEVIDYPEDPLRTFPTNGSG